MINSFMHDELGEVRFRNTIKVFIDGEKEEKVDLVLDSPYDTVEKVIILTAEDRLIFIMSDGERIESTTNHGDVFDIEKGLFYCIAKMNSEGYQFRTTNTQFHKFLKTLRTIYYYHRVVELKEE